MWFDSTVASVSTALGHGGDSDCNESIEEEEEEGDNANAGLSDLELDAGMHMMFYFDSNITLWTLEEYHKSQCAHPHFASLKHILFKVIILFHVVVPSSSEQIHVMLVMHSRQRGERHDDGHVILVVLE